MGRLSECGTTALPQALTIAPDGLPRPEKGAGKQYENDSSDDVIPRCNNETHVLGVAAVCL